GCGHLQQRISLRVGVAVARADVIAELAVEIDVVARRVCRARRGRREVGGRRLWPRRLRGVTRRPVDLAAQSGGATLAVLLEAYVEGGYGQPHVGDVVDDEPAQEGIAL